MIEAVADGIAPSDFSWFRPRTWSFTVHLALTMVVLAAVSLTGVTMISIRQIQSELSGQIGRQLEAQAQSLNNLTAFFLFDKVSDLRVLATSDDIIVSALARNESYTGTDEATLAGILALDREWIEAPETSPLIKSVITPDRVGNPAAFQLNRFLKSLDEHSELLLTDRRGATIAATGRLTDYYQADEAWWRSAWNDGKGSVYVAPPQFDDSADITAMMIAVPVYNGGDEPVGILRSTLNVADVLSVVSTVKIGNTGYASILDGEGRVFRDPSSNGLDASDIGIGRHLNAGLLAKTGHQTDSSAIVAHARLIRDNFDFSAITAVDDGIVDAVMGLGLITVVRQERDEALAAVNAIEKSGRYALYMAVVISIIIALLAARLVASPLKRLSVAAEAMGRGRLDTPLPPAYSGEISHLTDNLATMAHRLQDLIASLETRSAELADSNQSLKREVMERIRAEQELTRYRDQLEERINEHVRALEEAQVELMRREKLSALGQLTGKIAQEIRSPLGTLAASLYLIKKSLATVADERVDGALARADRSVKRCDRIVSELYTYSDRQSPSLQPTELDSWLVPVIDQFECPACAVLTTDLTSGATVLMDREHLHQAFDCVLLNAVQAVEESESGTGSVRIETRTTSARVEIRVADTGPGIAAEVQSHMFEPLYSTKPNGIGLGLPLAKAIMEEHGGGIDIEKGTDGGTAVVLWVPLPA